MSSALQPTNLTHPTIEYPKRPPAGLLSRRVFAGLFAGLLAVTAGLLLSGAPAAHAEQLQRLGDWDVHYALIRTSFLKPDIAARHGIVRGPDRALLNISVIGGDGKPVVAGVSGRVRNLLEQDTPLEFQEVREGAAVYYLAEVRHTDREVLRFFIDVAPPDGTAQRLEFQQQMYLDGR
ncbi:MAG: DUF4426 domain-containing protein [Lysobacterales bacterium]|nr:MAG: DUF4426 domain-containing protein [Xanthomonadales bacterium]